MYFSTPLLNSPYFDQPALLKLEYTQPSGSFKSRGITNLITTRAANHDKPHVYACSGGNAGLAAAEAAKELGIPCTVVVPCIAKERMRQRIAKLSANVVIHGNSFSDAEAHCQKLIAEAKERGETTINCHPFDDPLIWEGHSTMVDEIVEQIKAYRYENNTPSAIVLSCGGGGLYLGVMKGLERVGWANKVPVVVVETEGAATFHEALKAGKFITLGGITSIASSLGSVYVPEEAIQYGKKYHSRSVLVTDEDTLTAASKFAEDHNVVVEPACAATLAAIYKGELAEFSEGPIVAIVCGGSSYGPKDLKFSE